MNAASPTPDSRLYELVLLDAGSRLPDLHAYLQAQGLPLLASNGLETLGCWTPDGANADGRLVCLLRAGDRTARDAAWQAVSADAGWLQSAVPYRVQPSTLMALTDYSPPFEPLAPAEGRAFEFRTYEAAPGRLADLNARFRDHTLRLFEKHGLNNLAYWNLLPGQEGSETTLFYMLWHTDRPAGEAALLRFMADEEWKAALAASQVRGSLVAPPPRGVRSQYYEAAEYSPLR